MNSTSISKRGFTLVELAIVIVIAGILAAVAIPIYQGIVEKSKWTEGKTGVGGVQSALEVFRTEHSNDMSAYGSQASGVPAWTDLDIDPGEYNGQHFMAADYEDEITSAANPVTYLVRVNTSTTAGNPTEAGLVYEIDQDGNTTLASNAP